MSSTFRLAGTKMPPQRWIDFCVLPIPALRMWSVEWDDLKQGGKKQIPVIKNQRRSMDNMTKNKGVAILLFAILLQLCSSGMELLTLGVGALGLVLAIIEDRK